MSDEYYMNIALEFAKKAYKKNDVPVGAIIVKNDKIISYGYNKKNKKKCSIFHAEIVAIMSACKKLKTWHLDDCVLYVTLEPCLMCCGAILQSRISRVVYGAYCLKFGYVESVDNVLNSKKNNHRVLATGGVLERECSWILKKFFSDKR